MPSSHSLARLSIAVALLALLAGAVSCGAGHGLSGLSPLGAPDRPLRPAVVWRDWIASHDFTPSRPDAPIGAELTVIVRDVTRPELGLHGMRVDLITREASAALLAGATASSVGWRPPAGLEFATGVALPPLGVAADVPYVARVQHDGYRPVDVLVELLPSCRAVLEVYLQPGAPDAGAELPPPRAVLTTCRLPAPRELDAQSALLRTSAAGRIDTAAGARLADSSAAALIAADTVPATQALLYLLNASGRVLFESDYKISMDRKALAKLPRATYTVVTVAPGEHQLEFTPAKLKLSLEAGRRYFVLLQYRPARSQFLGVLGKPVLLKQLPEADALKLMQTLHRQPSTRPAA